MAIFAHRRRRDAGARKASKIQCFGTKKKHHWEDHKHRNHAKTHNFHDTKQRKATCFLVSKRTQKEHRRLQMARSGKNAKIDETLANIGGRKERKPILIDPQRPYFPR